MNLQHPDLYDLLRGPGIIISVLICISGCVYRINRLRQLTHSIQKIKSTKNFAENSPASILPAGIFSVKKIRNTIFGTNPVMGIISMIFHLLIFIIPVFLPAHNIIASQTVGLSIITIPENIMDIFTIILILIGLFFLARRIFVPRVRILSTVRDYFILLLVMAPFVTAFFAYHQIFNYQIVINIHMIISEIAIMIIPFTGIIHMPFLIFSRFFVAGEYSFKSAKRIW